MDDFEGSPVLKDGKSLILAYDHGLEHGPGDFQENPESADPAHIFELADHSAVTALAVQKGLAEKYSGSLGEETALVLKLNGNSNLWSPEDSYSPKNCSVEYAVEELGADAVGYTVYAGSDYEAEMFKDFREIQEAAREYGVPVIMWAYPRGHGIEGSQEYGGSTDPEVISYAARIGLELGADMVKCKYPGTGIGWKQVDNVTGSMKTVMSGGSKKGDTEFLKDVHSALENGGNGLAVGRNIFQRENPRPLLDKLEKVIFEGKKPEEV